MEKNAWISYYEERVPKNTGFYGKDPVNADKIINILKISKADTVLDIGCATGSFLTDINLKTSSGCYGIDISPIAIKLNKNKKIKLKIGNMESMPFKDQLFTKVFSLGVVEHTPNTLKVFSEINRVTKKGGKIYITVPNKVSFFHVTKRIKMAVKKWYIGYEKSFTKQELIKILEKTGFKLESFWIEPPLRVSNVFNFMDNKLNKINNRKFGFFIHFTAVKI